MSKNLDIDFLKQIPKGYIRTTATEEKEEMLAGDIAGSLDGREAIEKRRMSPDKHAFIQRPKVGIAFHKYVERSDQPKLQPDLLHQIVVEHGIESQKDELEKLIATYLSSSLFKRIQSAQQVLKEVPFSYFQDGILYEGYIDLILQENGMSTIVDLKTDQITASQLDERAKFYSKQLDIYAKALELGGHATEASNPAKGLKNEACPPIKVKDKVLYFVRLDKAINLK